MSLDEYSIEELEEIIKLKKKRKTEKPKLREDIDINSLIELCNEYFEELLIQGYVDDDWEHWFYEAVLIALYGKDIFDWIREHENN